MKTELIKPTSENLKICAEAIRRGEVVAFPTETVYGLGANGLDSSAVKRIFEAKGRPQTNPLTLHVCSLDQIESVAFLDDRAYKLIQRFMPGPITLILKKKDIVPSETVAGGQTVGVRMPASEIALKFISLSSVPIAAPSANSSGRPSPTSAEHVLSDLGGKIPFIIDGGECELGLESTIVDLSGKQTKILRLGCISEAEIKRAVGKVLIESAPLDPTKIPDGFMPKVKVIFVPLSFKQKAVSEKTLNDELLAGKKARIIKKRPSDEYAKVLFDEIRVAESEGYDTLIVQGVKNKGLGAAINSRIIKLSITSKGKR